MSTTEPRPADAFLDGCDADWSQDPALPDDEVDLFVLFVGAVDPAQRAREWAELAAAGALERDG